MQKDAFHLCKVLHISLSRQYNNLNWIGDTEGREGGRSKTHRKLLLLTLSQTWTLPFVANGGGEGGHQKGGLCQTKTTEIDNLFNSEY